jgi:branched-chain amino acid transport system permease protein
MRPKTALSILILGMIAIPIFLPYEGIIHYINLIFFFAAVTAAWNIISGFAGQLSLGHSAFFTVGAYTSTLLYTGYGITPWVGMVIGALISLPIAWLAGYPTFRLRGSYFVLATIALAEVLRRMLIYFRGITKGSSGILLPFKGSFKVLQFPNETGYYYLFLIMALLVIYVGWKVRYSRMGYFILALREDEDAAEALGVNIRRLKLNALMISAFFTAAMGSIYAQWTCYIDPDAVCSVEFSVQIALAGILGGMGTVWGPFVGAVILVLSQVVGFHLMGGIIGGVYMLYGALLITVVLIRPDGVIGLLEETYRSLAKQLSGRSATRAAH